MRSRGNIRRQFKLGVRRIIRLAPGHGSLVAADPDSAGRVEIGAS